LHEGVNSFFDTAALGMRVLDLLLSFILLHNLIICFVSSSLLPRSYVEAKSRSGQRLNIMMFEIFGNNAANDTIRWQPEPATRGTFGILLSCLITISLCIWTAVHLNVPEHNGEFRQLFRKGKWLFIGLLALELVLFTAWHQKIRAGEMAKMVTMNLRKVRRERKALTLAQLPPVDDIQTSQQQNEPAPLENHDKTTSRIKVKKNGTDEDGSDVEQGLGGKDEADKLKVATS
jgi:hypothetical protein